MGTLATAGSLADGLTRGYSRAPHSRLKNAGFSAHVPVLVLKPVLADVLFSRMNLITQFGASHAEVRS